MDLPPTEQGTQDLRLILIVLICPRRSCRSSNDESRRARTKTQHSNSARSNFKPSQTRRNADWSSVCYVGMVWSRHTVSLTSRLKYCMPALIKLDLRITGLFHPEQYEMLWNTSARRRNSLIGILRRAKSHSQAIQRKFNTDKVRFQNHEVALGGLIECRDP